MKTKLDGGWNIHTVVDGDWHLTIYISNDDETPVIEVEEDLNQGNEIGLRFTTEGIEKEYEEDIGKDYPIYCEMCGDQFFKGNIYYIYEDKKYCPYCAGSNDFIENAIEVIYLP